MTTNTYDETPPRRPGLLDLGGGAKVNDELAQPDPVRDLTADDANQTAMQVEGLARVTPLAVITMLWTGATHVAEHVASQLPGLTLATLADYLTRTTTGAGDVTFLFTPGKFPTAVSHHRASVLGTTPMQVACETLAGGLGMRVRTNNAGVAAHASLLLEIF